MRTKKRIEWIDLARGIAIVAVVIGHSLGKYFPGYFGNFIFAFHMPIFFVLSGYLYKNKSKRLLLKNSFLNLLIPYLTTIVIELVLLFFYKIFPNSIIAPSKTSSVKEFLISSIYASGGAVKVPYFNITLIPIGALWFLVAMFFATQIFNLVMTIPLKKSVELKRSIIFLALSFIGTYSARFIFLPFSIQPALLAQIFLYFGYLIKQYNVMKHIKLWMSMVMLVMWLVDARYNLFAFEGASANHIVFAIVIGCLSSLSVMIFCQKLGKTYHGSIINSVLIFWGRGSLLMLCFHLVDLDFVQIWPVVISILVPISYLLAIIVGMIYRVIFASFWTYLIPRLPILKNLYDNRNQPIKKIFQ